jgi:acyl-CoA dehydrogenase
MFNEPDEHQEIRDAVRQLCRQFPDEYFRKIDEQKAYPEKFVDALMEAGWLSAMIPDEYGGTGLGLTAASVIMEEINRSGETPARSMARCTTWARFSERQPCQKEKYLPASPRESCGSNRWR